jgi:sulfhydrogenase subunit beta (sulfur reductase)
VDGVRAFDRAGLDRLLAALRNQGRTVIGPVQANGVIDLDEIDAVGDLPIGWSDHQEPGRYELEPAGDGTVFGYVTTASSARRHLSPPHETLVRIRRTDGGFVVEPPPPDDRSLAFVGLRPCDVAGLDVADRVARAGVDERAVRRRADALIVAVDCTRSGPTCFCTSWGTGPTATTGHDLALTEIVDERGHRFLARAATERGAALLDEIPTRPAAADDMETARLGAGRAADQQRHVDPDGLHDALLGALEHDRWDDVADRCLACGNCTLVCPTCFCTTTEDRTDLGGDHAERSRRWESCFSLDHSHLGAASVRSTVHDRYRQWLTHKLATWVDQFGEVGCVGCGRCLTWCPVGIDLTEEVAALRSRPRPVGVAS